MQLDILFTQSPPTFTLESNFGRLQHVNSFGFKLQLVFIALVAKLRSKESLLSALGKCVILD